MGLKKQKILYIITKSNFGGAQRYIFELATGLPQDHFEIVVACGGTGILVEKLKKVGIRTYNIKSFARDINLLKELRSLRELWNIIHTERPDVVHLNSSKAGGSGTLIARLLGVPRIIFTAHGWPFFEERPVPIQSIIWFFSYITVLLAHKTIVVSHHDLQKAHMPFVAHKLIHINTAVPQFVFKERTVARAELFPHDVMLYHTQDTWVVSTGEHTRNKNLYMLIDAVIQVNKTLSPPIFLTLMGDGEDREHLKRYAEEQGAAKQIFFTGFVDDARSYLRAFDIFALPSRKEGLPYGLLEAGLAGLGCIASNVGGIPEIICDTTYGTLIDPHDVAALSHALQSYAKNPTHAILCGAALKAHIVNTYDLETMLRKTSTLYDSMSS